MEYYKLYPNKDIAVETNQNYIKFMEEAEVYKSEREHLFVNRDMLNSLYNVEDAKDISTRFFTNPYNILALFVASHVDELKKDETEKNKKECIAFFNEFIKNGGNFEVVRMGLTAQELAVLKKQKKMKKVDKNLLSYEKTLLEIIEKTFGMKTPYDAFFQKAIELGKVRKEYKSLLKDLVDPKTFLKNRLTLEKTIETLKSQLVALGKEFDTDMLMIIARMKQQRVKYEYEIKAIRNGLEYDENKEIPKSTRFAGALEVIEYASVRNEKEGMKAKKIRP